MSANDTQVAGDHYRIKGDKIQHWDLVIMYEWDYFQSQVIKYLMRWKFKHDTLGKRLEDLKKARHFLDKYIELQESKLDTVQPDICGHPTTGPGSPGYEERYYTAMSTGPSAQPTWYGNRE